MTRPSDKSLSFADMAWLAVILTLGFLVRLKLLFDMGAVIDADEGIVGLMAKHIVAGGSWPIFYYGQAYMGSLEPLLVAGLFTIMGVSSWALKTVPLYFSLLLIVLVFTLARRFTDRFGARLAALFAAFPPSALVLWSLMARGGFIELVAIGTLALILAVDLLESEQPRPVRFLLLGLVLGIGWWVNNQILFYLAPIGIVFLVHFLRREGVSRATGLGCLTLLGFFLGGSPFWYVNLFEEPRFQSFWLFDRASLSDQLSYLKGFFVEALPIILGARRFWSSEDVFPGATRLVFLLYSVVVGTIVTIWLYAPDGILLPRSQRPATRRPIGLLLLFLLFVPLIFSSSKFGWLSQAPRYLLPMYPVLFVLVGAAVSALRRSHAWGTAALSFAVTGFLLLVHVASNYAGDGAVPGEPIVFRQQRVAHDHGELYSWLSENNYTHIYTNYWIGYRVAFETQEKVTFTLFEGPQQLRIPEYPRLREKEDLGVYILVPAEAELIARGFADVGLMFRMTQVGAYVAIDHVVPIVPSGRKLRISASELSVPSREDWKERLVDGDLGTRWGSGKPQEGGMTVEVKLKKPTALIGFQIDYGFWPQDMPRDLTVEAQKIGPDGKPTWCVIADTRGNVGLKHLIDGMTTWRFYFPPETVTAVRLVEQGYDSIFDWSMAEFSLFTPLPEESLLDGDNTAWDEQYQFEVGENEYGL